jgi:hypothetical protein
MNGRNVEMGYEKEEQDYAGWRRAETVSLLLSPRWRRETTASLLPRFCVWGGGSDDDRYAENKAGVNAHLPNRNPTARLRDQRHVR